MVGNTWWEGVGPWQLTHVTACLQGLARSPPGMLQLHELVLDDTGCGPEAAIAIARMLAIIVSTCEGGTCTELLE